MKGNNVKKFKTSWTLWTSQTSLNLLTFWTSWTYLPDFLNQPGPYIPFGPSQPFGLPWSSKLPRPSELSRPNYPNHILIFEALKFFWNVPELFLRSFQRDSWNWNFNNFFCLNVFQEFQFWITTPTSTWFWKWLPHGRHNQKEAFNNWNSPKVAINKHYTRTCQR